MNFYIAGLRPSTEYFIKHIVEDRGSSDEGPLLTFASLEAEPDLPVHTAIQPSPAPSSQPIVLGASLVARFVATDLEGRVLWYYPRSMTFLTHPEPGGYFFGIHQDSTGSQVNQILRLFDLTGLTVFETNAARINEQLAAMGKRPINAFHHEARFLSTGDIVVLAGVEQILTDVQGPGPVNVLGEMILVLNRDLEVIWVWDAFDHLDVTRMATLSDRCGPGSCPPLYLAPQANDWLHANAITETPEGNLLLSMRSQDWVIKIDYRHGRGSGDVIWRLGRDGDFRASSTDPDIWFSHQHDPEIEVDGTLTLFDNSNGRRLENASANSRGQVFRLNERDRVAEVVLNADLGLYAFALGSAQRLENGNYFFDVGFLSTGNGVSVEVDPAGRRVYAIQSSAPEYRTFRMKNMYTP
jgi:hypothetical protein